MRSNRMTTRNSSATPISSHALNQSKVSDTSAYDPMTSATQSAGATVRTSSEEAVRGGWRSGTADLLDHDRERGRGRRTAWDEAVDLDDLVEALENGVGVPVRAASGGTRTEGDYGRRAQRALRIHGGCHVDGQRVGHRSGHGHDAVSGGRLTVDLEGRGRDRCLDLEAAACQRDVDEHDRSVPVPVPPTSHPATLRQPLPRGVTLRGPQTSTLRRTGVDRRVTICHDTPYSPGVSRPLDEFRVRIDVGGVRAVRSGHFPSGTGPLPNRYR